MNWNHWTNWRALPWQHWVALLLPTLLSALIVIVFVTAVMMLVTRWLRHHARSQHLARHIRSTLAAVAIVALLLIFARGSGLGASRLSWAQVTVWATGPGLRIVFIAAGAFILQRISDFFIGYMQQALTASEGGDASPLDRLERGKRIETLGRMLRGLAAFVIVGMAVLMILREANMDITPLLTGAGVAGVAIGFGAQSVVKDVIAGMFLILENQIRMGDIITINGKTGLVESIRLRILVLRDNDGSVYVFQNGAITEYTNLTKDFSYAVLELSVAYKEDVSRVTQVLQQVGDELQKDPKYGPKILAPLEILGIESLTSSAVSIKMRIKTAPVEQWAVDRELRRRVKVRFEQEKIALV